MPKIHLFEPLTNGSRGFTVEDSGESGSLGMVYGEEKLEYGVEARYHSPTESSYAHKRLGMTALEAANIIFEDASAETFVKEGLDAMYDEATGWYEARGETPPWLRISEGVK